MTIAGNNSEVIVVGGGVVGLSIAFRVQQTGHRVILLEKNQCGREASWAGAGIISAANPHRSDAMYRLHCQSIAQYESFCAELTDVSGIDTEYERCGSLDMLTTTQAVEMAESDVRVLADVTTADGKPAVEVIATDDIREVEPNIARNCLAFLLRRDTAQVRNPRLLAALRSACIEHGVDIREGSEVTRFAVEHDRVIGVDCGRYKFRAKHVVLCAGAWSTEIGHGKISDLFKVYPVRGQIMLLHCVDRPIRHVINRRKLYLVCRKDGRLLAGATEEHDSGFMKRNTPDGIRWLTLSTAAAVPKLVDYPVETMWAGLRPGTPDRRPYIGPVPGFEGLIAATGHFRTGLTLAPVTADIVCDLIATGSTAHDLRRCKPGRSFDQPGSVAHRPIIS